MKSYDLNLNKEIIHIEHTNFKTKSDDGTLNLIFCITICERILEVWESQSS